MTNPEQERFEEIADQLDLDDFERLTAWNLHLQLNADPFNDKLNIQLGSLLGPKIVTWLA